MKPFINNLPSLKAIISKKMSRSELNVSRWLEAHSDRNASLKTLPRNAILADVAGDGDYRLVLTDLKLDKDVRSRLKIYKGTLLVSDQALQEIPAAIVSFYTDKIEPKIPAVAVACGPDLFIYKNTKPFYRFTIPSGLISATEAEIWERIYEENADYQKIIEDLKNVSYSALSPRSQHLLNLPLTKIGDFITNFMGSKPTKCSTITCMTTLNRSSPEQDAPACPVLATESGDLYILDPQSFIILHQANICSTKATPCILTSTGLYDVEFRILIVCRENKVCLLRRGWVEGKVLIQTTTDIVDLITVPGDNFIMFATADKNLHCYTKRGQRIWTVKMVNNVTTLSLVPLNHLSAHLVAVGLKGGMIHLYHGRHPVDFTSVADTPSCITFGQLGQEEHVMIVVTIGGTINFKILKRTADFNLSNHEAHSSPLLQSRPLPLPKRSKLFLEQSLREKQYAVEMHQSFQQDLVKLRLTTARSLAQNLNDQNGVGNEKEQIKLSAQVLGLGPKFILILSLENMNNEKPIYNLNIIFHVDRKFYVLSSYLKELPLIPPSMSFKVETKVDEQIDSDVAMPEENKNVIRVFVMRTNQVQPVLAATINMPPTELI